MSANPFTGWPATAGASATNVPKVPRQRGQRALAIADQCNPVDLRSTNNCVWAPLPVQYSTLFIVNSLALIIVTLLLKQEAGKATDLGDAQRDHDSFSRGDAIIAG